MSCIQCSFLSTYLLPVEYLHRYSISFYYISKSKTIGFIKRNIHGCTQKVKQHTFTTMARPTLEYASTCWDPHSKDLIEDIEQVQKEQHILFTIITGVKNQGALQTC